MESINRVLVPTDFSPTAWQAVIAGIKISQSFDVPLIVMHIIPDPQDQEYIGEVAEKLRNIVHNLSSLYRVDVHSEIALGEPIDEINRYIETSKTDLVVMGLNGSGSNEIGSVTSRLLHDLNCPVLLIPAHREEPVLV